MQDEVQTQTSQVLECQRQALATLEGLGAERTAFQKVHRMYVETSMKADTHLHGSAWE